MGLIINVGEVIVGFCASVLIRLEARVLFKCFVGVCILRWLLLVLLGCVDMAYFIGWATVLLVFGDSC